MALPGELEVGDYVEVVGLSDNWVRQGEAGQVVRVHDSTDRYGMGTPKNAAVVRFTKKGPEDRHPLECTYAPKWLRKICAAEALARIDELP
jgi:hypothetical protein